MKKTILQIFLASASVSILLFSTVAHAANRYWVGTGNSSTMWEDTNNWSALLKGAGGASVPGASDVAIIRGTGGTVSMGSNVSVLGLTMHPTWTGSVIVGTGTLTVGTTGIRVGSGRLIAQGGTVKNAGNLTQTGGIVTIKNLSLSGSLSITNVNPTIATFTSTGVIILNNASADQNFIQTGNISTTFTNLTVRNTAGTTNDDIIVSGSGLVVLGALTITLGNLDLTTNSIALTVGGGITLANAAQATLTTNSNVTASGNILVNDAAILTVTAGTWTLNDDGNQTVDLDGQRIHGLTINNTGGGTSDNVIIAGGGLTLSGALLVTLGNLDLATNSQVLLADGGITLANTAQASLTTNSNVSASGTILVNDAATLTVTAGTWTLNDDGNQAVDFDGQGLYNLTLNLPTSGSDIVSVGSTLNVDNNLTITQGHLALGGNTVDLEGNLVIANDADATMTATGTLTVAGNITKSVLGTLALTGSTLTLDGTNQTLSGSITYNNLRKLPTVARTLTFAAGTTHRVVGTLTLKIIANGGGANVLSLVSSQPSTTWILASSTYNIAWLSVQDSAPSGAITCLTCTDAGNNSGWVFRSTATETTTAATSTGGGGGGTRSNANTTQAAISQSRSIADAVSAVNLPEVRQKLLVSIDGKNVVLTDTPANAWFAPYVYVLVRDGVVSGYRDARGKPTGEYGPANHVTYGEIAKMAAESAGISVKSSAPKNRSAKGHWSAGYISALEGLGVSVFNSSNLNVNDKAPRGAVVQILLETFAVQMQNAVGGGYSDVPASGEYANAIETATEAEIVSGDDNATTFRPNAPVNRAEVAKIVSKTIDKYK